MSNPLLTIEHLSVHIPGRKSLFNKTRPERILVDDVSLTIDEGEVLGLAGESGSGKSTLARTLVSILPFAIPGVKIKGKILYHEEAHTLNLLKATPPELNRFRKNVQMVFQDPFSSLNPRMTIRETLLEPLILHAQTLSRSEKKDRLADILSKTGLSPNFLDRYPHEFSGGQRQRIALARALILYPRLVIADEPVSALDVSIQAQILNLLLELRESMNLSYLIIGHDLGALRAVSNRIGIMNHGKIVELEETETLFSSPKDEYTQNLLHSILPV